MAETPPTSPRPQSPARKAARGLLLVLVVAGALGMVLSIWLIIHQNRELRLTRMGSCGAPPVPDELDVPRLTPTAETAAAAIPHGPILPELRAAEREDTPPMPHGFVDLELAFTRDRAAAILAEWPAAGDGPGAPCAEVVDKAREILRLDYGLLASYAVALTALCLLVGRVFRRHQRRAWNLTTGLPAAAAVFNLVENSLLKRQLEGAYELALWTSLAGLAKLTLLAATLIGLVIVGFAWLGRRLSAPKTRTATPLDEVLAAEKRYLAQRRQNAGLPARDHQIGLALSGGGMRSATINLGVLQALARRGVLPRFDYLSTVSGGGYIGSALSSLLSINGARVDTSPDGKRGQYLFTKYDDDQKDEAWFTTEHERFPFNEQDRRGEDGRRGFGGSEQMRHLRAAGGFLVGRQQLFSLEMLRVMGAVLGGILYHLLHFGLFLVVWSAGYLWVLYQMVGDRATYLSAGQEQYRDYVKEAFGMTIPWGWEHPFFAAFVTGFVATAITLLLAQQLLLQLPDRWFLRTGLTTGHSRNVAAVYAMVVTMLVVGLGILSTWFRFELPDKLVNISIPLVSYLGGGACLGILHGWVKASRRFRRTHRSRLAAQEGAFVVIIAVSLVFVLLVLPFWAFFEDVVAYLSERPVGSLIGWLLTLLGARLFAGGEQQLDNAQGVLGRLLARFPGLRKVFLSTAVFAAVVGGWLLISVGIWKLEERYSLEPEAFRLTMLAISLILFLLSGLLNFNRLALHYFYRDRLVEAYLRTAASDLDSDGALKLLRDNEELRMRELHGRRHHNGQEDCVTSAPYHLLVTCLNLSADERPRQATRKTDQFVFSRLFCGSETTGFEKSSSYRGGATRLAEAMTISGAAASPAMGRRAFFAQSVAMTLFNVRLGQWIENPAWRGGTKPWRVSFWPPYLLKELLASCAANGRLVYLSDGGHSGDNLGIYPLLKRRCRLILAVDAEHDPRGTANSLVEALRQVQIDEGVSVDIDLAPLRPDPDSGRSPAHFVAGTIHYADEEEPGTLIVIKSSLTGDEPAMIGNYRQNNQAFPHESTGDLFFDDAQFEAYRQLGEHMVKTLLAADEVSKSAFGPPQNG